LENPFEGILKINRKQTKSAATRAEAYALATALKAIGEPHLGAAALICFEWLQRPENVLTGNITWPDYRGPEHADRVRIFHHKTGEVVLQPLEDGGRKLYPELEAYLAELPRLGVPIVVTKGSRGPSRPYAMVYAQAKVREARERAGLGSRVTLDACRHGGMTELGDAELAKLDLPRFGGEASTVSTPYSKTPAAGKFDVVMAWAIDRLGRTLIDLLRTIQDLEAVGVDLYLDQQHLDTTTPTGKLLFQVTGAFSEFERSMIQQRVNAGLSAIKAEIKRDGHFTTKAGIVRRRLGRPGAEPSQMTRARQELARGIGIGKVARLTGLGTGTVHKLKREMQAT